MRSQAKATNLAEANALERAEAAAADLERKTPLKRSKKKHRTSKVSRSMKAKVAAAFDSDGDGEDDYENDSMRLLTSEDEYSGKCGHTNGPVHEEKSEDEELAGATPGADPDERDMEVEERSGDIRTPGPAAKPHSQTEISFGTVRVM